MSIEIISTHSLTRRLTKDLGIITEGMDISTHSLTRRLTTVPDAFPGVPTYFNSQPHKEADN